MTSKLCLHLSKKLFTRFDMQPVVVFNDDDRVAARQMWRRWRASEGSTMRPDASTLRL